MIDVDLETVRSLIAQQLPHRVRWLVFDTPLDYDFARARAPLRPLQDKECLGDLEDAWKQLYLFGEWDYSEGGGAHPFVGVHATTGIVYGLDVERASSQMFLINSTVDRFARTFLLFDAALRQRRIALSTLAVAACEIDPAAYPSSDWSDLVQYLVSE